MKNEGEKRHGKWILRKTFEKKIPTQIAWREKSPMQDGSGTSGLTNLFESIIGNDKFEEQKKKIKQSDGVVIRSKESMYYYDIFRKFYDNPSSDGKKFYFCCNGCRRIFIKKPRKYKNN